MIRRAGQSGDDILIQWKRIHPQEEHLTRFIIIHKLRRYTRNPATRTGGLFSLSLFYDINKLDLACNLQSPASGKEQKGEMGPRFVLFSTARSMACIRRRHCCHRCTKDSIIGKEWQRVPVLEVLRATDSSTA